MARHFTHLQMSMTRVPQTSGLVTLPKELLHAIFRYAQNPRLAHVCRKLWFELPGFVSCSQRLAQEAFTNQVKIDIPASMTFFQRYPLPPYNVSQERVAEILGVERSQLQESICCGWLTVAQLRKLRHWIIRDELKSVYHQFGIHVTSSEQQAITQYFEEKEGEDFQLDRSGPGRNYWRAGDFVSRARFIDGMEIHIVASTHQIVLLSGPDRDGTPPLKFQPFLPADHIPARLIYQIAKFDERSRELTEVVAQMRILEWDLRYSEPRVYSQTLLDADASKAIRQSIFQVLEFVGDNASVADEQQREDQGLPPKKLVQDCMLSLLKLARVATPENCRYTRTPWIHEGYWLPEDPMSPPMSANPLAIRPMLIEPEYYRHVIANRNLAGLKLLLQYNWALVIPNETQLRKMMVEELYRHLRKDLNVSTSRSKVDNLNNLNELMRQAEERGEPEWREMSSFIRQVTKEATEFRNRPEDRARWAYLKMRHGRGPPTRRGRRS